MIQTHPDWILPGGILTVVIRDDSPLIHCNDMPSYRSVQVKLTEDQLQALRLRYIGRSGDVAHYEAVSRAFLEPTPPPEPPGQEEG